MSADNLKGVVLRPCICPIPIENGWAFVSTAPTYLKTLWPRLKRRWPLLSRSHRGAKRLLMKLVSKL